MAKPLLRVSTVLTALLLGYLHYALKPAPTERQLQEYAQGMTSSTEWKGQIAPDFELETISGERFHVSDNIGKKIIVLNFFATWCGPCREEMPELNRYDNEHKGESFLLVAIDAEETRDRVEGYFKELKLGFPVGIDAGAIAKQYDVTALPTTVLIGVDGKVQFYEMGALANADVAFDNLLQQNRKLIDKGEVISAEDYRQQAQKQPTLPVHQAETPPPPKDPYPLDGRGKAIVAKMDCPCGCDKKVQGCTCTTSNNIKKALSTEDFKGKSDDEVIKSLNKRFCGGPS
jgi:thiol-disulfide isomerase/thioredoxin